MTEPAEREEIDRTQMLKLGLEVAPVVVFFLVNFRWGLMTGTAVFMVATIISLIASRVLLKHIPLMPLVTGVFVIGFGALTLALDDETFIKVKPTIVNGLFAAILLVGLAFKQSFLKLLLGPVFRLSEEGWRLLTLRWGLFFIVLAVLNEIVWRNASNGFWISLKIWGVMPLTFAFAMAQLGLLRRHGLEPAEPESGPSGGGTLPP